MHKIIRSIKHLKNIETRQNFSINKYILTSSVSQESRRRKLLYHSRKRGRVETELFFGSYATDNIWKMSDEELDLFESLLVEQDVDLYNWVLGKTPIPPEHQNELFEKILTYIHTKKHLTTFNDDYEKEEGFPKE
eukprot:gene11141-3963_t